LWCGLRRVSHSFGDRRVLCDLDLSIGEGERVAVVGPSGSGKTTLLSILGLLVSPTKGEVVIQNEQVSDVSDLPPGTIAWVQQTTNVFQRWTVLDNVGFAAMAADVAKEEAFERAQAALVLVGLEPLREQQARRLSGGERQRLCIARALAAQAVLLLLDEPTGQLDRETTEVVVEHLWKASEGITSVLATHDLSIADRCDRIVALEYGRLVTVNA
jgi:putative ABC transport system ATP-binding protein